MRPAAEASPVGTSTATLAVPTTAVGAAETVATPTPTFIAAANPVAAVGGVMVDAAPAAVAALTTAATFLPAGSQPPSMFLQQNPAIYGVDGPAIAVIDAADVLPPPIEVTDAAPAAMPPVVPPVPLAAATPAPALVVAPPATEEEAGTPWNWIAVASAVVIAGGYWAARRYQLVKRLAARLRAPALPVRA